MKPVGPLVRGELARMIRYAVADPPQARAYAELLLADLELPPDAGIVSILERLRELEALEGPEDPVVGVVAQAWRMLQEERAAEADAEATPLQLTP